MTSEYDIRRKWKKGLLFYTQVYTLARIVNLEVKNRYFLKRYSKGVTVMLEKKLSIVNIGRLKAISLLEADFNT